MDRPPIMDAARIVEVTRQHGSIDYPAWSIPGDFTTWRRRIRQAAAEAGRRVSVRRFDELVLVYDPDYIPTDEQHAADVHAIISSLLTDEPKVSYDEELHRRRRARLKVVRDEHPLH